MEEETFMNKNKLEVHEGGKSQPSKETPSDPELNNANGNRLFLIFQTLGEIKEALRHTATKSEIEGIKGDIKGFDEKLSGLGGKLEEQINGINKHLDKLPGIWTITLSVVIPLAILIILVLFRLYIPPASFLSPLD